jgi:hypothetical protein
MPNLSILRSTRRTTSRTLEYVGPAAKMLSTQTTVFTASLPTTTSVTAAAMSGALFHPIGSLPTCARSNGM